MTVGRIMSPEAAFAAVMRQANTPTSQAKGTITKTEAEKALTQLEGHPHADATERARIVQGFLDGKEGKALSPKAKEVLADFVKTQGQEAGGQKADQLKAAAAKDVRGAGAAINKALVDVAALLQKGMVGKGSLATVTKALDSALASVGDARKNLTGLLKVADHAAKTADDLLKTAGGELQTAKNDVARLVASAKGGAITKAQLQNVVTWLNEPRTELAGAQRQLGDGGLGLFTKKAPSDLEDGGFNGGGMGGGAPGTGGGGMTTLKFPSDNEDGQGAGGGGGVMHTMKAPSDHEDGSFNGGGPGGGLPVDNGGPMIHPKKPDTIKQARLDTMGLVFRNAEKAGQVQWHNSMPIGQRFESALIMKEKHPDGYAFSAMVPTGAMSPTAQQKDPNEVNTFWIRRSGGIAGMTQYAGPFDVPQKAILPMR